MRANKTETAGITYLDFTCPGCKSTHQVPVTGPQAWGWDGSVDRPTLTPSLLVTWRANPKAGPEFSEWHKDRRCHSFIRDGRIEFLSDSTHLLAGQTVDIADV